MNVSDCEKLPERHKYDSQQWNFQAFKCVEYLKAEVQ